MNFVTCEFVTLSTLHNFIGRKKQKFYSSMLKLYNIIIIYIINIYIIIYIYLYILLIFSIADISNLLNVTKSNVTK
jgi:hypothetical protein